MACGSMKRWPLVPADSSMQDCPIATPTATVLICIGEASRWSIPDVRRSARCMTCRSPCCAVLLEAHLVANVRHGVEDGCTLRLEAHLHGRLYCYKRLINRLQHRKTVRGYMM